MFQDIREKIPADPLEAELLMMAEVVAGKEESSSSSDEDEVSGMLTAASLLVYRLLDRPVN